MIEFDGISVSHGDGQVLFDIGGRVEPGRTLTLLGPSGSGKTTLLHALAGFVDVQAGEIRINGRVCSTPEHTRPPELRRVGVVFQQGALWPHMTLAENVEFPLRQSGATAPEAGRRADELLESLDLGAVRDRRPSQVSGGQQQRAGVARAIARDPAVYLLDEPTAHLDAPLRSDVLRVLRDEQRRTGAAVVLATHDPSEGLAVADEVMVLREGRIAQVGTPADVYGRPNDAWTARMTGTVSVLSFPGEDPAASFATIVRPEWVSMGTGEREGTVTECWFRGDHVELELATDWGPLFVRTPTGSRPDRGTVVRWSLDHSWPLDGRQTPP